MNQPPLLPENSPPALLRQQRLLQKLCGRGSPLNNKNHFQVRLEETHISWVLLVGRDAYKIKKAINLGFLDFSTLALRQFYCAEELRLNRRLAPALYLDLMAIGGSIEEPVPGKQPVVEYAVHMRRFPQAGMMNRMLARGMVTLAHIDKLAGIVANFHTTLTPAAPDSTFCSIATIEQAALENFAPLLDLLSDPDDLAMLKKVRQDCAMEFASCSPLFLQRAASGWVRECHGDLHLGNIVVLDDVPTPFDCIEFSPALRWIDVISEISFTVMDLLRRGRPNLAWRLLNAYLEITGDYSGIGVLRFYLAYRAMVRAKINAIRTRQHGEKIKDGVKSCRAYLRLAHSSLTRRRPFLIITHGLPGCGKSTFAQIALEQFGAIRIRSDVERKRLFGLAALADSKTKIATDIYSEEATKRTYARLRELARVVLAAGFPVIVDAVFALPSEREIFRMLAKEIGVLFIIARVQADGMAMEDRLTQRNRLGNDASEADVSILKKLQIVQTPLRNEELPWTVTFNNNGDIDALRSQIGRWKPVANVPPS